MIAYLGLNTWHIAVKYMQYINVYIKYTVDITLPNFVHLKYDFDFIKQYMQRIGEYKQAMVKILHGYVV